MCPFTPLPPKNPKNQNFEKMKNNCWRYYFTHVYQKSQSYDVWFLRYWVRQHNLSFWAIFCLFTPLMTTKIKILKKWKQNAWRYYPFIHTCVSYMKIMYGSWNIRFDRQCFVLLGNFLPFHPPWRPRKSKFWKTEKTPGDIILHIRITINDNHMMCGSWDMNHDRIACHFRPFFALLPF